MRRFSACVVLVVVASTNLLTVLAPLGVLIARDPKAEDADAFQSVTGRIGNGFLLGPEGYRWTVHTAGRGYSLILQGGSYRFELRPGDHWQGDGPKTPRTRSEISGLRVPSSGRSTISYEVMVVAGDFDTPGVQHVIGQRHGRADLTDRRGEHPVLAFRVLPGGRPSLTVSGSREQPLKSIPKSRYPWTGAASDFPKGVWHRVVIDSYSGRRGWADLWLDGRLKKQHPKDLHTFTGDLGYINAQDDYWKFGDYCARGARSIIVICYRNIKRLEPNDLRYGRWPLIVQTPIVLAEAVAEGLRMSTGKRLTANSSAAV